MLIIKILLLLLLLLLIYLIGAILYAQFTDYKPAAEEKAETFQQFKKTIEKDTLVFYDWNIGYCGLGKESSFFFDAKGFVKQNIYPYGIDVMPTKEWNAKNYEGFLSTLKKWHEDADFINIQEIDRNSKRSYHTDQVEGAKEILQDFNYE